MPNHTDDRTLVRVVDWAGDDDEWEGFRAEVFNRHFSRLMAELELSNDELFDRIGPTAPVVIAAVMEDLLARRFGDDGARNLVDEYLARRGWIEKRQAAAYLRAVRDSTPSLYEVVDLDPGRAVTVRDLVRETDPVRVPDVAVSETLALWDCCVGRLVGSGRMRRFGVGMMPYPRELARTCQEDLTRAVKRIGRRLRQQARKRGESLDVEERDLRDALLDDPNLPIYFTQMFVRWRVGVSEAPRDGLRNTDDEPLVPSSVRFPLEGSTAEVAAALDELPEFDREDGGELGWSWLGREMPAPPLPEALTGDDAEAGVGHPTLGQAEITGGALLLRVNSADRAEQGRELLVSRLGPLVGTPRTSPEDPAKQRQSTGEGPPTGRDLDLPPAIDEALLRAHFEQHYRQVLDEPIPVLGNVSPRQAAKSRKGRAALVEWLKGLGNSEAQHAAQTGREPFDTAWLWEELKIPRPGGGR